MAPCAFAISVPVTVVAAIGAATRSRVLIKGELLWRLSRKCACLLSTTGTLRRNEPRVVTTILMTGATEDELLEMAAALESSSDHPWQQPSLLVTSLEAERSRWKLLPGAAWKGVSTVCRSFGQTGLYRARRARRRSGDLAVGRSDGRSGGTLGQVGRGDRCARRTQRRGGGGGG